MKAMVLLFGDAGDARPWDELSTADQQAEFDRHRAFSAAVEAREGCAVTGGEALAGASTATTVRGPDGSRVLTDGPFAESSEVLGGFYVVEAPSLDVLLELLEELPPYTMEIRPLWDVEAHQP